MIDKHAKEAGRESDAKGHGYHTSRAFIITAKAELINDHRPPMSS
jgi:hypothetical protein